ncbi:cyclic AMP-responsive element-binding protein 1 isoform X3 [Podarcis raffonei]|uniref:cyclic AMP-responsive element-binding protein 1 isoform X3 n=1 Tax=Podarcis raffonei TaxID=65483 RepID=UPI002329970B|nr:cyclic AMP-responsive element-binding protein 1 isoform X3 [Podarcis raffonei]
MFQLQFSCEKHCHVDCPYSVNFQGWSWGGGQMKSMVLATVFCPGPQCGPDFLLGTGVADINHQYGNALHAVAITQGGAIQLANNGTDGVQGLQTLTMTNAAATQPGTTILQYAQTTDGQQILVPSNQVVVQAASGDVQTYQIRTAPTSTIAPGVVMASSPALPTQPAEEAARKREVRLMKNREAARECRRKKKEYVKCLENRVAVLENQNKTLIEELKALKDLYCHKSD